MSDSDDEFSLSPEQLEAARKLQHQWEAERNAQLERLSAAEKARRQKHRQSQIHEAEYAAQAALTAIRNECASTVFDLESKLAEINAKLENPDVAARGPNLKNTRWKWWNDDDESDLWGTLAFLDATIVIASHHGVGSWKHPTPTTVLVEFPETSTEYLLAFGGKESVSFSAMDASGQGKPDGCGELIPEKEYFPYGSRHIEHGQNVSFTLMNIVTEGSTKLGNTHFGMQWVPSENNFAHDIDEIQNGGYWGSGSWSGHAFVLRAMPSKQILFCFYMEPNASPEIVFRLDDRFLELIGPAKTSSGDPLIDERHAVQDCLKALKTFDTQNLVPEGLSQSAQFRLHCQLAEEARRQAATSSIPPDAPTPVYMLRSFVGLFGDPYTSNTELEGGSPYGGLRLLINAFTLVLKDFPNWLQEEGVEIPNDSVSRVIEELRFSDEQVGQAMWGALDSNDSESFVQMITWNRNRLNSMSVGEHTLYMGGWSRPGKGASHAVAYIVEKTSPDTFAFIVCNTGSGVGYHPSTMVSAPKGKCRTSLRFDNIPAERMLDDVLWFGILRQQAIVSSANGPQVLYEVLIPRMLGNRRLLDGLASMEEDPLSDWRTPQRSGTCYFKSVLEAARYLFRSAGLDKVQTKHMFLLLRRAVVAQVATDLQQPYIHALANSHRTLIRLSTEQLARATAKREKHLTADALERIHRLNMQVLELADRLPAINSSDQVLPPPLDLQLEVLDDLALGDDECKQSASTQHMLSSVMSLPGFDLIATGIEATENEAKFLGPVIERKQDEMPDFLSLHHLDVSNIDDCVSRVHAMVLHLEKVDTASALYLRHALILGVFLNVLPFPSPISESTGEPEKECSWRTFNDPSSYKRMEQLVDIFKSLICAFRSVQTDQAMVNSTIVVAGVILACFDASYRAASSRLSNFYAGRGGEVWGIATCTSSGETLASVCAHMTLAFPCLIRGRDALLSYFKSVDNAAGPDRIIWDFRTRKQFVEDDPTFQFVIQWCLATGMALSPEQGLHESESHIEAAARWCAFGDDQLNGNAAYRFFHVQRWLVAHFKLLLLPIGHADIPPVRRWKREQICNYFNIGETYGLPVTAVRFEGAVFDHKVELHFAAGSMGQRADPRTYLQVKKSADDDEAEEKNDDSSTSHVYTEDDVLHHMDLPRFGGSLSEEDAEQLLCYFTAIYGRIPLVLAFFLERDRVNTLLNPEIRNVLESVLFAPGPWTSAEEYASTSDNFLQNVSIPLSHEQLATPSGILFNELLHAPGATLSPLLDIVNFALSKLDLEECNSSCVDVLLFLICTLVRVQSYVCTLLSDELRTRNVPVFADRASIDESHFQVLSTWADKLHETLHVQLRQVVERWAAQARTLHLVQREVAFQAHLALLDRNMALHADPDRMKNLLCHMFFFVRWYSARTKKTSSDDDARAMESLDANFEQDADNSGDGEDETEDKANSEDKEAKTETAGGSTADRLGPLPHVPQLDMFDLLNVRRRANIEWIQHASAEQLQTVASAVCTAAGYQSPAGAWSFVPDRRGRIISADSMIEIDFQLCQVFLKQSQLQPVPDTVASTHIFQTLFGAHPHQCGDHESSGSHRDLRRLRLFLAEGSSPGLEHPEGVGTQHELLIWSSMMFSDQDVVPIGGPIVHQSANVNSNAGEEEKGAVAGNSYFIEFQGQRYSRVYRLPIRGAVADEYSIGQSADATLALPVSERWLRPLLDEALVDAFTKYGDDASFECPFVFYLPERVAGFAQQTITLLAHASGQPMPLGTFLEIKVYRDRGMFHVFQLVEHGRRMYRSLKYTSDSRLCLRSTLHKLFISEKAKMPHAFPTYARHGSGMIMPLPIISLGSVVYRRTDPSGESWEMLPPRLLWGLLPDALLETHLFWRSCDSGTLRGFPNKDASADASKFLYQADIMYLGADPVLDGPAEHEMLVSARVYRFHRAAAHSRSEELQLLDNCVPIWNPDSDAGSLVLVDSCNAPRDSVVFRIVTQFMRIEDASHVLIWATEDGQLSLIDLPRLGLQFEPRADRNGELQLASLDHNGWFVSNVRESELQNLADGIPNMLLLENGTHQLTFLIPNVKPVVPLINPRPFNTEFVPDRSNPLWLSIIPTKYYMYPVHPSRLFLLPPSLAASLYLVLLRLLARQYRRATRLVGGCQADVALTQEERWPWNFIGRTLKDGHPDACAIRCRLYVGTMESGTPAWNPGKDLQKYIQGRSHVSTICWMSSVEEELLMGGSGVNLALKKASDAAAEGSGVHNADPLAFLHAARRIELAEEKGGLIDFAPDVLTFPGRNGDGGTTHWQRQVEFQVKDYCESAGKDYFENPNHLHQTWFVSATYERPKNASASGWMSAADLLSLANHIWSDTIIGAKHKTGFYAMYQLATGQLRGSLNPNHPQEDDAYNMGVGLASILVQLVAGSATQWGKKSIQHWASDHAVRTFPYAALAVALGPAGQEHCLPVLDDMWSSDLKKRIANGVNSWVLHPPGSSLAETVHTIMHSIADNAPSAWLESLEESAQPEVDYPEPPVSAIEVTSRAPFIPWKIQSPYVSDTSCQQRLLGPGLTPEESDGNADQDEIVNGPAPLEIPAELAISYSDLKAVGTIPLADLSLDDWVAQLRSSIKIDPSFPFDLSSHVSVKKSPIAQRFIQSLVDDRQHYASSKNVKKVPHIANMMQWDLEDAVMSPGSAEVKSLLIQLQRLQDALLDLKQKDRNYVQHAFKWMASESNRVDVDSSRQSDDIRKERLVFLLLRHCRQRAPLHFIYLASASISSRSVQDVRRLNPALPTPAVLRLLNVAQAMMLHTTRIGHINRCVAKAESVCKSLLKLGRSGPDAINQLNHAGTSLAKLLTSGRYYVRERGGHLFQFDPRYLVFEFMFNLLLRAKQVDLIDKFHKCEADGGSMVHQMIMGAGKTTVIGPMLALVCADGHRLVSQVVPKSLLEMSRNVLRSRFAVIIPKRVHTFSFGRNSHAGSSPMAAKRLLHKLQRARQERDVVVTTPGAIQSLQLRMVELLHLLHSAPSRRSAEVSVKLEQYSETANALAGIIRLWRGGVLLMDEVDMLLHPLRSELNFPIGHKHKLDMAPDRWELPGWLFKAVFVASLERFSDIVDDLDVSKQSSVARDLLINLNQVVLSGYKQKSIQSSPHLVLLDRNWYHQSLAPVLSDWLLLFLESKHVSAVQNGVSEDDIRKYLMYGAGAGGGAADRIREQMSGEQMKFLNLGHDWLKSLLPHCLSKLDRVSYGILSASDIDSLLSQGAHIPQTRKMLAVPFVGKDVPSASSEFAHPDVLIGLTILAYRYEGLRQTDVLNLLSRLQSSLKHETGPVNQRPSAVLYASWLQASTGREAQAMVAESGSQSSSSAMENKDNRTQPLSDTLLNMPLALVQPMDKKQIARLHRFLRFVPQAVQYYLQNHVFPDCTEHQIVKISSSGQDLGGDALFGQRLGFSGTPSELLPLEMGKCQFQQGANAEVLDVLTDQDIVSTKVLGEDWSVHSLLKHVATGGYHALIDTAPLVTGMSNRDVAAFLLKHGLPDVDGVIYLDRLDRKMILLRENMHRPVLASQCGVALHRRFAFYDQVHTTGMDIKHRASARAAVTIGKDMTFRDYAQGCYRMRGIGQGQTLTAIVIPEVLNLIQEQLPSFSLDQDGDDDDNDGESMSLRLAIAAWLHLSSIASERLQFAQLLHQNLRNVVRKNAQHTMLESCLGSDWAPDRGEDEMQVVLSSCSENVARAPLEVFSGTMWAWCHDGHNRNGTVHLLPGGIVLSSWHTGSWQVANEEDSWDIIIHMGGIAHFITLSEDQRSFKVAHSANGPHQSSGRLLDTPTRSLLESDTMSEAAFEHRVEGEEKCEHPICISIITPDGEERAVAEIWPGCTHYLQAEIGTVAIVWDAHSATKFFTFVVDKYMGSGVRYVLSMKKLLSGCATGVKNDNAKASSGPGGVDRFQHNEPLRQATALFREPIEFAIADTVPEFKPYQQVLSEMVNSDVCQPFKQSSIDQETITHILSLAEEFGDAHETGGDEEGKGDDDNSPLESADLDSSMICEQEQEVRTTQEVEQETTAELQYLRTEEAQRSWDVRALSDDRLPENMYQLSDFSVFPMLPPAKDSDDASNDEEEKKDEGPKNSISLHFPSDIVATSNFYRREWSQGPRRPKNVDIIMEWVPDVNNLKTKQTIMRLSKEQRSRFKAAFDALDFEQNGHIPLDRLPQVLESAGLGHLSRDEIGQVTAAAAAKALDGNNDGLDFNEFSALIAAFRNNREEGRRFVAISLLEAQSLRRVMHSLHSRSKMFGSDDVALRLFSAVGNRTLQATKNFKVGPVVQHSTAVSVLRFINCDLHFDPDEVSRLMGSLNEDTPQERAAFFEQVLQHRRRERRDWDDTSLAQVFTLHSEWHLIEYRAKLQRLRAGVAGRGQGLLDAFRSFDENGDGWLTHTEILHAFRALGVSVSMADVEAIFKLEDKDHGGTFSYLEFVALLSQ